MREQLVQLGWKVEFGEPKSEASGRVIPLDNATTDVLRQQHTRQAALRRALGEDWEDSGLVFTNPDGSPLHPAKVTDAFHDLAAAAELPPVRLHDLRHGPAAALALVDELDLDTYHPFHATRADLFQRLGRTAEASAAYRRAAGLAPTDAEREFLRLGGRASR